MSEATNTAPTKAPQGKGRELPTPERDPVVALVIGMAGSGKSTLMQRMTAHLHQKEGSTPYVVNLDPAVAETTFGPNIDIRDTVDYANVMKEYQLGPNGAIMTALNLFATRFDKVLDLCEKRAPEVSHFLVDTPGQIEVFTWSASGAIITEALASSFPTVVVYVVDVARAVSPVTFMSNMMYACSIMYRTRLPMVIAFNKCDVTDATFALEWMEDVETFHEAVAGEDTYMGSLAQSMSMMLHHFYEGIKAVPVSAVTGAGIDNLFTAIGEGRDQYFEDYLPDLHQRMRDQEKKEAESKRVNSEKLAADLSKESGGPPSSPAPPPMGSTTAQAVGLSATTEESSAPFHFHSNAASGAMGASAVPEQAELENEAATGFGDEDHAATVSAAMQTLDLEMDMDPDDLSSSDDDADDDAIAALM